MFEHITAEIKESTIRPYQDVVEPLYQILKMTFIPIVGVERIVAAAIIFLVITPVAFLLGQGKEKALEALDALVTGISMFLAPAMYALGLLTRMVATIISVYTHVEQVAQYAIPAVNIEDDIGDLPNADVQDVDVEAAEERFFDDNGREYVFDTDNNIVYVADEEYVSVIDESDTESVQRFNLVGFFAEDNQAEDGSDVTQAEDAANELGEVVVTPRYS
jgi:hypothetical protein